jgi:hypothetical protein
MKWMDEDKYIWAILAFTLFFFTLQMVRAGLTYVRGW